MGWLVFVCGGEGGSRELGQGKRKQFLFCVHVFCLVLVREGCQRKQFLFVFRLLSRSS